MAIIPRKRADGTTAYGVKVRRDGRQVWVGTFDTRPVARREQARAIASAGEWSEETIEGFAERWVDDYPRERESTNRRYRYAARALADRKGRVKLCELTRGQARALAHEHPDTWTVWRAMFADALEDGLIETNPFAGLRGIRRSRGRRDEQPPTEADVQAIATAAEVIHTGPYGRHFAAMIRFAFYVGLRAGELFALRVSDIDADAGEVRVARSVDDVGEVGPTKTYRERTVVLGPPAAAAVEAACRTAPAGVGAGRLFVSKRGKALRRQNHHALWAPVAAAAGWPGLDWHMLRHACATHLIDVLRLDHDAVAKHLGHANASEVIGRYGHPSDRLARDRIRAAFGPAHNTATGMPGGQLSLGGA